MEKAAFEKQREIQVEKIQERLLEASDLMSALNQNMEERTGRLGESAALAEVWLQFRRRIVHLSGIAGSSQ